MSELLVGLLVVALLFLCEYHGYSEGKGRGFAQGYERGYCKGHADANLWWIKTEEGVDEARHKIWRDNT